MELRDKIETRRVDVSETNRKRTVKLVARTDRLFATPTLLSGAARALDLAGTFNAYNVSSTPEEADALALASDWGVVGNDLWEAFHRLQSSMPTTAGD